MSDNAIIYNHRIPLRPHAHVGNGQIHIKAHRRGKSGIAVRQHQNFPLRVGLLAPCFHDMRIVDSGAGDRIHTFTSDCGGLLNETGQMVHRAGWCKCPRHPYQNYFFAGKNLVSCELRLPVGIKTDEFCCG